MAARQSDAQMSDHQGWQRRPHARQPCSWGDASSRPTTRTKRENARAATATKATTEADVRRQVNAREWKMDMWSATLFVWWMEDGEPTHVAVLAITRTIDGCRDFDGCPMHGPHPGQARAAFYASTAAILARQVGKMLRRRPVAVRVIGEPMLERAAHIMTEVGAIIVLDGLTDGDLTIEVADAH